MLLVEVALKIMVVKQLNLSKRGSSYEHFTFGIEKVLLWTGPFEQKTRKNCQQFVFYEHQEYNLHYEKKSGL